ncbi:MAG: STAS domain-containing protein [Alphaproteobacteria bacterium]|nr:STAS domain-containing protein [Alphaproteobacteria bacterium]
MNTDTKKLHIEQTKDNGRIFCKLSGWLDPNTTPELIEKIDLKNVTSLVFDMKDVEYVFSSGLRALLLFEKKLAEQNGNILLINVSDTLRTIFEYTGFENMLEPKQ